MAKLLDKFASALPRLQARNIERELQSPSNRLRLFTPEEFRGAFQEQLRTLLENETMVRLDPYSLEYDRPRDSELVDDMLKTLAGDLSALFFEANLFLEAEELQSDLYRNEIVGKLRRAVDEAEAEIERLELLSGNTTGLKAALVERFRDASSRMPRSDPFAYTAYLDPKLNITPGPELDMPVAVNVGGLVLPALHRETIRPSNIKDVRNSDTRNELADRYALPGSVSASTPGATSHEGRLGNIIDRQRGTYWVKTLETGRVEPGGAKLNISIDLGPSPTGVNFIEIHPVSNFDMELAEVYYVDGLARANRIELETAPVNATEQFRLFFRRVNARKLVLIFTQKNWEEVTDVGGARYRYKFGLDNILVGEIRYAETGYYVSKTLTLPQITKVHLAAKENSFLGVPQGESLSPILDSLPVVEYWVMVREIDGSGNIVSSLHLPILPVGRTSVREKLFAEANNKARLSFMINPDIADDDPDLAVYRNGMEVLRPADYRFEPPAVTLAGPATLEIDSGYNLGHEYVAEYAPLHTQEGTAPIPFMDATELVRYAPDNTIRLSRPAASQAVRSEANLIVIMRGLGNGVHTSVVDQITFAVG